MLGYLVIVSLCCVTTSTTALFCSTIFRRSATSLISTYVIILVLFAAPVAAGYFAESFYRESDAIRTVGQFGVLSPFSATFALPLEIEHDGKMMSVASPNLLLFFGYFGWSILYNGILLLSMMQLFQVRWRVAD
jgi:hypothetical protein